jgi:hypothetical protein
MATQRALGPSAVRTTYATFLPATPEESEAVHAHLGRILASPAFRNSKRYASVLRYVVERTVEGAGDQLKERTIGIEVFGRAPDYDTGSDHAVRSAASEVRKRLAQYYQEETNPAQLRIGLQPGSYVPQFRWSYQGVSLRPVEAPADRERGAIVVPGGQPGVRPALRLWIAGLGLVVVACLAASLFLAKRQDPIERFWGPLWSSKAEVLICVGNLEGGRQADGTASGESVPLTLRDFHRTESEIVHVDDAITLARIAGLIRAKGKPYRIASQTEATFTDLQNGPAVLIGLMNNDWTGRLVQNLRFTVEHPTREVILIRDRDNPSRNDWSVDYSMPYLNVTRDYALVLRVSDPKTEQMVVTVAGISAFGTLAAGEFLTNPNEIRKIEAIAPKGWEKKNLEMVLSMDVIRGRPGHANVVAARFW